VSGPRSSQGRYVPAAELERAVEVLYEGVRIPAALRQRLERVLRTEVAERERHPERKRRSSWAGGFASSRTNGRSSCAPTTPTPSTCRHSSASRRGSTRKWRRPSHSSRTMGEKLDPAKQIIDVALNLAKDCEASYRRARPEFRKIWNRAFFRTIRVRDGMIADLAYEEPFASLLGSHRGSIVEVRGFEPLTPAVRRQCSTGLSYTPGSAPA
jgi:hypothetical protein